ncbi:hypothetical protein Tco_0576606 [Tanacetum coccineum]
MEDEHLNIILATESDEVIKSSVKNLVQIPSESRGILDKMCDVPFRDNSPPLDILKDQFEGFSDSNNDSTSIDDNSFSIDDIDYVEASPPDSELVSLEEVKDFHTEDGEIEDDILRAVPLPFAGELAYIISPPEYDCFYFKNEPDQGNFMMDVVEDIFDNPIREPRVHVPNVLPIHPTLHLDSDFTLSSDSLGSGLAVSFPFGTRNKIFDPRIFIGVQSMRFLSLDEFSISFIHDLPFPVIGTFLSFSPQNEFKVFNPGILASNEETSPHLLSYRGFNPSKIISDFSERPMMIYGGDIPILDVPFLHFYPP